MIALYFVIVLAVAASVLVEEDEIDNSNALSVAEQDEKSDSKQFISSVINQLKRIRLPNNQPIKAI